MNATADGTTCCSDVTASQGRVSLCVGDKKEKDRVQLTLLAKNIETLGMQGCGVSALHTHAVHVAVFCFTELLKLLQKLWQGQMVTKYQWTASQCTEYQKIADMPACCCFNNP